jgi:hypothetical protein
LQAKLNIIQLKDIFMKKVFMMLFLAVGTSVAMAQSQKVLRGTTHFSATLAEFSYNGKAQIYIKEDDLGSGVSNKQTFIFYDDAFTKQNELTIYPVEFELYHKFEERIWDGDGFKGAWKVDDNQWQELACIIPMNLNDFDQSCDDFRKVYLSQTIFNTDDKYEYLLPIISTNNKSHEEDRDGDGQIDMKEAWSNANVTGFKVVSETGAILQTVNFENGFYIDDLSKMEVDLLKINGKLHLSFEGCTDDNYKAFLIYSIESTTNGVRMMTMEKVSATKSYNLSGRPSNGDKGINIIRLSDGTIKKVLVK